MEIQKYLLALFDVKKNTLISMNVLEDKSEKTIKKFLIKSTRNLKSNFNNNRFKIKLQITNNIIVI